MKKIIVIVIAIAMVGMYCLASWMDTHYTKQDCEVVAIEGTYVTVEDNTGHDWGFTCENHDDYELRETVDLKMYTNHTDNNIYDDEIIEVK